MASGEWRVTRQRTQGRFGEEMRASERAETGKISHSSGARLRASRVCRYIPARPIPDRRGLLKPIRKQTSHRKTKNGFERQQFAQSIK